MFTKKIIYLVIISFLLGCSPTKNFEIVSLWNIREHNPKIGTFYRCDECNTESLDCCVYEYRNKKYDRGESYILDANGKIDSVYSYAVPLGVNEISVEE